MAWTTPRTWVAGETLTSTLLNTHLRDNLTFIYGQFGVGWVDLTSYGAFTYNGVDTQTGVINTPANLTAVVPIGAKFQYVQGGVTKNAIVVGVAAGTITLYTGDPAVGTDFTLANVAITAPSFAISKQPLNWSPDPTKWRIELNDRTAHSQASPVSGTWYNLGGLSLAIPIGAWSLEKSCGFEIYDNGTVASEGKTTLSTANNTESDPDFTSSLGGYLPGGSVPIGIAAAHYARKNIALGIKTSFFLNGAQSTAGTGFTIAVGSFNAAAGDSQPSIIRATSAYI